MPTLFCSITQLRTSGPQSIAVMAQLAPEMSVKATSEYWSDALFKTIPYQEPAEAGAKTMRLFFFPTHSMLPSTLMATENESRWSYWGMEASFSVVGLHKILTPGEIDRRALRFTKMSPMTR